MLVRQSWDGIFLGKMWRSDSKGGRASQLNDGLEGEADTEPEFWQEADLAGLTVGENAIIES